MYKIARYVTYVWGIDEAVTTPIHHHQGGADRRGKQKQERKKEKIKIRRGSTSRGEKNDDLAQLPLELSAPLATTTTTGAAQRGAVLRPSSKFLA